MQIMVHAGNWKQSPHNVQLLENDVHVWHAMLDVAEEKLPFFSQILDVEEQTRANRFYFEPHRTRFIVSHGLLRVILGSCMNIEPDKLRFSYNSQGKPFLAESFQGKQLQFNMSHSQEFALFAVTFNRQVGVDLEYMYQIAETDSLANRILSKQEITAWCKFPPDERLDVLFRYWACKEACVKATGDGMAQPLEEIHISLTRGSEARLISINSSVREASRWSLHELHPLPGFAAALVVEGFDYRLNHWQWTQH